MLPPNPYILTPCTPFLPSMASYTFNQPPPPQRLFPLTAPPPYMNTPLPQQPLALLNSPGHPSRLPLLQPLPAPPPSHYNSNAVFMPCTVPRPLQSLPQQINRDPSMATLQAASPSSTAPPSVPVTVSATETSLAPPTASTDAPAVTSSVRRVSIAQADSPREDKVPDEGRGRSSSVPSEKSLKRCFAPSSRCPSEGGQSTVYGLPVSRSTSIETDHSPTQAQPAIPPQSQQHSPTHLLPSSPVSHSTAPGMWGGWAEGTGSVLDGGHVELRKTETNNETEITSYLAADIAEQITAKNVRSGDIKRLEIILSGIPTHAYQTNQQRQTPSSQAYVHPSYTDYAVKCPLFYASGFPLPPDRSPPGRVFFRGTLPPLEDTSEPPSPTQSIPSLPSLPQSPDLLPSLLPPFQTATASDLPNSAFSVHLSTPGPPTSGEGGDAGERGEGGVDSSHSLWSAHNLNFASGSRENTSSQYLPMQIVPT
eukprot:GHVQ01017553.1.p1 GENE.GHVQ01017553.1~~GHVQ01017553.1.p1  ORF type:complete len:531 (-),score=97.11 GHVQ01017553.1:1336-2775(-)